MIRLFWLTLPVPSFRDSLEINYLEHRYSSWNLCFLDRMTRIPDRSAGPEQVRSYIRRTLTSRHKTDDNLAEEAARSWRLGRGSELYDATLEYLQEIFGVDIGFCLFQSICEDRDNAWEKSLVGIICSCKFWQNVYIVRYRLMNFYIGMLYASAMFLLWSIITFFLGHRSSCKGSSLLSSV
jgi:hypothetical protein